MGNNNLYSKTGNFMSNTHDLTEGNVTKQLLTFTVPVMLGALFQQFYNIVDTAIVGRTLGVDALAAVGATGSVLLQTSVNGLGSDFVAAQTSGGKISVFAVCPLDSLGTALATFTGQNIGAKKLDRIDEGLKSSLIIGTIYSVVLFGVMFVAGDKFALIFVEPEKTAIIANIHKFLIANSSAYVLLLGVDVFRFMIQGMGFSYLAIISGVMEMIARGIMGIFFVSKLGFIAACFASPLAWVLADMFLIPAYIVLRKKVRVGLAYE